MKDQEKEYLLEVNLIQFRERDLRKSGNKFKKNDRKKKSSDKIKSRNPIFNPI